MIREWRPRRRISQFALACDAEISPKHLSFLETGRSLPSRETLLRLAERLVVPLRDRNVMLHAAGFAPSYSERPLDDPDLRLTRQSIDLILAMHEPNPAVAVDRHWTMAGSNRAAANLVSGVDPLLLTPPVNVIRLIPTSLKIDTWRPLFHVMARLVRATCSSTVRR
jgi:transcriptional regulator with XRE-family HTH domain